MRKTAQTDWALANQRHLVAAVAHVRAVLAQHFQLEEEESVAQAQQRLDAAAAALPSPAALDFVSGCFELSAFERQVLVLCAGVELDGEFAEFVGELPGAGGVARVNFSLALAALPDAHWSALGPDGPLRYWRLVELAPGSGLVQSPLRLDERILHALTGTPALDRRLEDRVERVAPARDIPPSHAKLAAGLAETWRAAGVEWPVLQLCGSDPAAQREVAAAACRELNMQLHVLDARDVPPHAAERHEWLRLWERESILSDSALLVDCSEASGPEAIRAVQRARGAVMVSTREVLVLAPRASLRIDVPHPTHDEQRELWQQALGADVAAAQNGTIDAVIAHFDLPPAAIALTGRLAQSEYARRHPSDVSPGQATVSETPPRARAHAPSPLWDLCRGQLASRLGELAQRIETRAQWDALVLPGPQKAFLGAIISQVRQRIKVYERWGFAENSARGLGLSALFAGPSGTGKTMAAEVIAGALNLDLYRIDLSAVVSKYIGETEKNLRRVFDAAESGGAVLLFDEADALFGRRSEVKDSHDRYANIEVSYLLQRMEAYRGLAILTTNMKEALDAAFVRRLRFILHFPYPDGEQRHRIWEKILPSKTPTRGLDFVKLARLNVTGGSIRNIALHSAFLAADANEAVQMHHLLAAAQAEAAKLERPLMETEVAGWI